MIFGFRSTFMLSMTLSLILNGEIQSASANPTVGETLSGYDYTVTDVASLGLTAQGLYQELSRSWMDLEHSVCSNRAHIWAYDLKRKYGIQPGTLFVFFGKNAWKGEKKKYWYHAAPYVIENGVVKVLEGSYPSELSTPLDLVAWMNNEMEGRVDASRCIEIKKGDDADLTEFFYYRSFLPHRRANGKPAFDCYYRKAPGYMAYPEVVAEQEFGKDENGEPVEVMPARFDRDVILNACIDSYAGRNFFKKSKAREFCKKRYGI